MSAIEAGWRLTYCICFGLQWIIGLCTLWCKLVHMMYKSLC